MTSTASNFADAIGEAVRAAASAHSPSLTAAEIDGVTIELWIQTGVTRMASDASVIEHEFQLGLDGVSLTAEGRRACFKPSVATTLSAGSAQELLRRLCGKLNLPETAWAAKDAVVHRTTWMHAVEMREHPEGWLRFERLRPTPEVSFTRKRVASAVRRCVRHLLNIQHADGGLGYQYNPLRDEWQLDESRVRFAGCAYSLARAATHELTSSILQVQHGAARLLSYLRTKLVETNAGSFIAESDPDRIWGKLGAAALTLLALEHFQPDETFSLVKDRLRHTVLRQQRSDGLFSCRFQDDEERESEQDYFPGEALLALTRSAGRTGCKRVHKAIRSAFGAYRDRFRCQPSTAFVPWQAEVWTQVHGLHISGDAPVLMCEEVAAFVFEQIDWLLPAQYGAHEAVPAYMHGGFLRPSIPTISSASHLEGILHGLRLADQLRQTARVARYRAAARACLRFVLDLQVPDECAFLFPSPEHIVGAAVGSPLTFGFRCDYDQHFVTSLLTAYDTPALWRDD